MARVKKEKLSLEELLEKILVKKEDQPYDVPSNWVWTTIDVINNFKSKSIEPKKLPDKVFELYSVPSCDLDYPEILKGEDIGSSKQQVEKDDVLLCKINPRINRVWIVTKHTENELIASGEWIAIRNRQLNAKYLMWCFKSKYFREYLLSNVSGVGGSLMRAQPKYVKGYPVPLPPLAEQQRIVDRIESLFEKLDRAKELAQNALDSFENRKAAILHKAFTGELTAKWREENGVSLDSWKKKSLGDIIEYSKEKYNPDVDKDTRVYIGLEHIEKNMGIIARGASTEVKSLKTVFKKGDILYGKLRPYLNKHDIVDFDGICSTDILVIRTKTGICNRYINYLIGTTHFIEYAVANSKGINLPRISEKEISKYICSIPSIEEQEKIVDIVEDIMKSEQQAQELCDVIEKIELMKKAILARAFRGELGTNNLAEESAIELLKEVLKEKP